MNKYYTGNYSKEYKKIRRMLKDGFMVEVDAGNPTKECFKDWMDAPYDDQFNATACMVFVGESLPTLQTNI